MDTSVIYYTANRIPPTFANKIRENIKEVSGGIPIISVSHHPIDFGTNIVVDDEVSHVQIYRNALIGAKEATTKYICLAEDDVLYTPDHFTYKPTKGKFAYNLNVWSLFTWGDPIFHQKEGGRRNMYSLVCERNLFIQAMEERFRVWPDDDKIDLSVWAEPSKYEKYLGVKVQEWDPFYSEVPLVAFSHQTALSFGNLGKRKKQGQIKLDRIPFWNRAEDVIKLYV